MATAPSKFDRLPKALPGIRDFNAVKGIFYILIGAVLYMGHAAFIPVALAMLFGLILSSPVEAMHKSGVPRGLSSVFILILALAAIAGLVALLWSPAQEWYASAPQTLSVIQKKITPVARLMSHLEELTNRAGAMAATAPGGHAATVAVPQTDAASAALAVVRDSVVALATFVMLTLFLLRPAARPWWPG